MAEQQNYPRPPAPLHPQLALRRCEDEAEKLRSEIGKINESLKKLKPSGKRANELCEQIGALEAKLAGVEKSVKSWKEGIAKYPSWQKLPE